RAFFRALPGGRAQIRSQPATTPLPQPASLPQAGDAASLIRRLLADALGYGDPADIPDNLGFFELGLDSLTAVRLRRQLEEALQRPVPATALFSHPTVARLAAFLDLRAASGGGVVSVSPSAATDGPIAVIGIGCRFPGGIEDFESFGEAVFAGLDAIREVPPDRWDWRKVAQAASDGELDATRWGGFLTGIDAFDAAFFSIAPREATYMDPQQRLLLETAWRAAEHGGLDPASLAGSRTGVFVGMTGSDYAEIVRGAGLEHLAAQAIMGLPATTAAGRISHTLGLQGPAIVVDTACSSSLTALHLACRSLASGECDMALAGGVNLILSAQTSIILARAGMLSRGGRCRTFDAGADGFVRAEGCGMVLLKPLQAALADGDPVLAVIRGTAMNHDGRASGLTVPSGSAQEQVLRAAIAQAGVDPAEIGYVELHGTGTALGDPIEASALANVLCGERTSPLLLGSFKTNIGHAESASGIGGLIRAIAALRARTAPPNLHFDALNPLIEDKALQVPVSATSLPDDARYAGVSGFGASGTNVHVVIEAAPSAEKRDIAARPPRIPVAFRRQRFWIDGVEPVVLPAAPADDASREGHLFRLEWEEGPLPGAVIAGRWLILGDGIAVKAIAATWRDLGIDAVTDAAPDATGFDGILALSNAGSSTSAIVDELVRLGAIADAATCPVFVVTRGGLQVGQGDAVSPGGAAVIALGRALALRVPATFGGTIDVAGAIAETDPQFLARALAFALATGETELALRGSRMHLPRLARMDVPAIPAIAPGGAALGTGAFGGIGKQIVRSLFARGVRHFALIGR
ncbi:MAG TPA: beta-ketoacyl synthase N-terminal-like domain-containing protein, partial [Saliniramus sp.]|nr:beta-ketoacyl synthase N-terminal-like domain-containing protein [Saliniramus sp.]